MKELKPLADGTLRVGTIVYPTDIDEVAEETVCAEVPKEYAREVYGVVIEVGYKQYAICWCNQTEDDTGFYREAWYEKYELTTNQEEYFNLLDEVYENAEMGL